MKPKLTQSDIEQRINMLKKVYEDTDSAPEILKGELDILRDYIISMTDDQLETITKMLSYQLKPIDLKIKELKRQEQTEEQRKEQERYSARYAIMRGYRGTIKTECAWRFPKKASEHITFIIAAANDHKSAADKVTQFGFSNIRFYQRKNASNLFEEAISSINNKLVNLETITPRDIYFLHVEAFYNDKSFFSLLKHYASKRLNPPQRVEENQIRYLIGQTALRITNNSTFLYRNARDLYTREKAKDAQRKYPQETLEMIELSPSLEQKLQEKYQQSLRLI